MSHGTWIHKVSRAVVVRPLIRTRVTPNHLTTVRLATGLAAAAGLAIGTGPWPDIGAGLFVASMLFDRADGELARMTGQTSAAGHRYDLIADALSNAAVFIALGWGLSAAGTEPWPVLMGLVAGLSIAAVLGLVVHIEKVGGACSAELAGAAGFDPDDAMLAVPVAVWLGWSDTVLVAAAIGAPVFALFFLLRFRSDLFGAGT